MGSRLRSTWSSLSPDSPDGLALCQRRAPISAARPSSYGEVGSRILTDATGERTNPRFRQRFRGLRVCRPDPNGESGLNVLHAVVLHASGGGMKADWQILAELAVFLDPDPDGEDIAAAAFDRLGFPNYAEHYDPDLVRQLVLELERRHEAAFVVREYGEEGLGLLYYEH